MMRKAQDIRALALRPEIRVLNKEIRVLDKEREIRVLVPRPKMVFATAILSGFNIPQSVIGKILLMAGQSQDGLWVFVRV